MKTLQLTLPGVHSADALRLLAPVFAYFAQVSLCAAAACIFARVFAQRHATQNVLWRFALLLPIATTLLPFVYWEESAAASKYALLVVHTEAAAGERDESRWDGPVPARATEARTTEAAWDGLGLLAPVLLGVVGIGLLRIVASFLALRRALADRVEVRDERLCERFRSLATRMAQRNVLLTQSHYAPGPLVVGLREVCIPAGLMADFCDADVDAVFAHELAHIERRDGLWFAVIGVVEALFWPHPLNRFLSARCRETAELAADDRAVAITRSPLALARSITRMAEALRARPPAGLVPSMAASRTLTLQRVERLIAESEASVRREPRAARPRGVLVHAAAIALLACLVVMTVNVRAVITKPRAGRVGAARTAELATTYDEEMDALAARAWRLEAQLGAAARSAPPLEAMDLMQLEQDLRHVREMQAWTERRRAATKP